jgi:hypothetical protein
MSKLDDAQEALVRQFGTSGAWDYVMLQRMAVCVVRAIREPSDEMVREGCAAKSLDEGVTGIYSGMIDKLLEGE